MLAGGRGAQPNSSATLERAEETCPSHCNTAAEMPAEHRTFLDTLTGVLPFFGTGSSTSSWIASGRFFADDLDATPPGAAPARGVLNWSCFLELATLPALSPALSDGDRGVALAAPPCAAAAALGVRMLTSRASS